MTTNDKDEMRPSQNVAVSKPVQDASDADGSIMSRVPWMAEPVSAVLAGVTTVRKRERARELLNGLSVDLAQLQPEVEAAAREYVRTEDFEDLLEQTLRRVGEERLEEKRRLYRAFLLNEVSSPGQTFDEQTRILRTFEVLTPDHIKILKAVTTIPPPDSGLMGSPLRTLHLRAPDLNEARIKEVVADLNSQRLTNLQSLIVMMSAHGAADLRTSMTDYGNRVLAYILAADKLS